MGDKSLKSKQRDQKQKDAAKVGSAATAKSKQVAYPSRAARGARARNRGQAVGAASTKDEPDEAPVIRLRRQ